MVVVSVLAILARCDRFKLFSFSPIIVKRMTSVRPSIASLFKNAIILAAILVSAIIIYLYIFKFNNNIYGFFRIGSVLPFSPYLDIQKALIFQGELGFDGQQFLSIAFDPFLHNSDTLSTLDSPRLRYRRILYPLLGYIFGLGNARFIPYAMVAINFVSIILLVWLVSQYLKQDRERKTWLSLLVLCIPGIWIVLSLSTADLLNSLLTIAAIYFYQKQQIVRSAAAIAAACLTKEISVMMGLALLLTSIWQRKWKQIPYLLAALIPAIFWNLYVLFRLDSQGFLGVSENFGYPFFGIAQKSFALFAGGLSGKNLFEAYSFLLLLGIFAANWVISTRSLKGNRVVFLGTLLYGVLFVSSNMSMLGYFLNYPRQYMDVYFLLLLSQSDRFNGLKIGLMAAAGFSSVTFLLAHS